MKDHVLDRLQRRQNDCQHRGWPGRDTGLHNEQESVEHPARDDTESCRETVKEKTFSTIEKIKVREATASLVRDKGAQGSEAKLQIGLRPTARRHDGWLA